MYHVRKMARILSRADDPDVTWMASDSNAANQKERLPTIQEANILLQSLPDTNWFVRNNALQQSDDVKQVSDVCVFFCC